MDFRLSFIRRDPTAMTTVGTSIWAPSTRHSLRLRRWSRLAIEAAAVTLCLRVRLVVCVRMKQRLGGRRSRAKSPCLRKPTRLFATSLETNKKTVESVPRNYLECEQLALECE